jgi:hypothetical protein
VLRGNESRAHRTIVHTRITVPALSRKLRDLVHIIRTTDGQCGRRYGGSSRISGTGGPLNSVRESTVAATSAVSVLNRYIPIIRSPCTGTNPKTLDGGNSVPMINV